MVHLLIQSLNIAKIVPSNALFVMAQLLQSVLSARLQIQSIISSKSIKIFARVTAQMDSTEMQLLCCVSLAAQPVQFVLTQLQTVPHVKV